MEANYDLTNVIQYSELGHTDDESMALARSLAIANRTMAKPNESEDSSDTDSDDSATREHYSRYETQYLHRQHAEADGRDWLWQNDSMA